MKIAVARTSGFLRLACVLVLGGILAACDGASPFGQIGKKVEQIDTPAADLTTDVQPVQPDAAQPVQPDAAQLENARVVAPDDLILRPAAVLVGSSAVFVHTFTLPEETPTACFIGYQIVTWQKMLGRGALSWTLREHGSDQVLANGRASLENLQDWQTLWLSIPSLASETVYDIQLEAVENADIDYGFASGESSNIIDSQFRIKSDVDDAEGQLLGISYRLIPC